jgi:nucleoside-diphosphate kinase
MEQTYVMVKPDGVQRNLVGKIIAKFEKRGLKIAALKMMQISPETAAQHYAEHVGKPFYNGLISYITAGPVVAMVLEGKDAVKVARHTIGATNPQNADTGSIRGMYAIDLGRNVIHGADSVESAQREIALYFKAEDILSYNKPADTWIYE